MTTEPQAQPPAAPERFWLIPSPWGLLPQSTKPTKSEAVEYVRADLPRAAADDDAELVEAVASPWICVEEKPCEEAVPVHWQEMITALAAIRTPRAETGLTVEAALKELRELFPGKNTLRIGVGIQVGFASFGGPTLDEAMDQIRAWAKSRAERKGQSGG